MARRHEKRAARATSPAIDIDSDDPEILRMAINVLLQENRRLRGLAQGKQPQQPTVTAVSADKSLIRIENYGDYVSREKVERWSEFAGDYTVDIVGRLMRLDGQLDDRRTLIKENVLTPSALKPFVGEYIAVRVKLHSILRRFNLSEHIPEYAAIIQVINAREHAILDALDGNFMPLMQSNLDDSPIYQNMMIGAEHIERAGKKLDEVWDWIIRAGKSLQDGHEDTNNCVPPYDSYLLPELIKLSRGDTNAPDGTSDFLQSYITYENKRGKFKTHYKDNRDTRRNNRGWDV